MEETENTSGDAVKGSSSFLKGLVMVLLSLLVGGAIVYGVAKKKPEFLGLPKGSAQVQSDTQSLVDEVGKLIELPTDEKPNIATITDIEKVKDQPFFKNAQNGDKVLIYINAKKAILYRESENKIIEVGPVNMTQTSASPSASAQAVPVQTTQPSPQ